MATTRYLLDTNVLIAMFRGNRDVRGNILKAGFENCFVSEISIAELFYGAAKAAMTAYLSGLRVRLLHSHKEWLRQQSHALGGNHSHSNRQRMQVLTILPGYVRTKMVSGRKLPPLITATPEQVAADIVRAMERGQDVLYTIWMWRYIMLVTQHIPECVFKRLHMF